MRTETPQPADISQSFPTLESVLKLASHLENTHCNASQNADCPVKQ